MLACPAMLTVRLWHNPNCRHSTRALGKLQELGVEVEIYAYLDQPPTAEQLSAIAERLEEPVTDLVDRDHPAAPPLLMKGVSTEQIISSLAADPTLLRAPIGECGERVQVGRPAIVILGVLRPTGPSPHLSALAQQANPEQR